MCGFIAAFSPNACISQHVITGALEEIKHRGPDDSAIWASQDKKVWLGHTRLSIIDIKGGSQPLSTPDGLIHCVVNGEFYDYVSIRDDLTALGYHFKTQSDSEILLYLYQHYGVNCLEYLRGEFSFVLWDENLQQVFAARDRFGIKPLFYYHKNNTLYLASEVKALKALGVPMVWDKSAFLQDVSNQHLPNACLFKHIYEVSPGHYLLKYADEHQMTSQMYWDLHYPNEALQAQQSFDDEEVIAGFREQFYQAVRLRLKADVPVACYLSGGIDSCSILGAAQKLMTDKVTAFTLSFDNPVYDEALFAKAMAEYAGSHYHSVNISGELIAAYYEDAIFKAEKCAVNSHFVAKYLLSRVVREQGFKVVLTGEGADEILAGYAHFRQDYIANYLSHLPLDEQNEILEELKAANQVSQGLLVSTQKVNSLSLVQNVLGHVPNWMVGLNVIGREVQSLFSSDYAQYCTYRLPSNILLNHLSIDALRGASPLHKSLYTWTKSSLPHYMLTLLGDRVEMAHSIEGRLPFLDHKLAEYVISLPEKYKIRGMKEKYVLRESMKPELTDEMYVRQKHPFLAPPVQDKRNEKLNEYMMDILHSKMAGEVPFFNQKKTIDYFDHLDELTPERKNIADSVMNLIVSSIIIQDKFGMQSD
ncbi:asparagine synthase (glutamine-hydrolyzing) [uncultured Shewanella sp.]|uniref:asparagine synthase (glutamine-hydrolyzing) n=1 Tax=uncultured Shewanella sp. TaxID=173975 RepID=UPI00260D8D01|nr:asparagine synthase (glutamine-hydrolyzing) [uncultured Shewanella sp.]